MSLAKTETRTIETHQKKEAFALRCQLGCLKKSKTRLINEKRKTHKNFQRLWKSFMANRLNRRKAFSTETINRNLRKILAANTAVKDPEFRKSSLNLENVCLETLLLFSGSQQLVTFLDHNNNLKAMCTWNWGNVSYNEGKAAYLNASVLNSDICFQNWI